MHLQKYKKKKIYQAFDEMYKDWSTQTKSDAQQILAGITSFDFIITFLTVYQHLSHLSGLTVKLQGSSVDILQGHEMVQEVKDTYREERSQAEEEFAKIYSQAVRMAEKVGTEPTKPRVVGRQQHRSNVASLSICDPYRLNLAIPFLDHINENLDTQFSSLARKSASLLGLVPAIICKTSVIDIDEAIRIYSSDLPSPELVSQELQTKEV